MSFSAKEGCFVSKIKSKKRPDKHVTGQNVKRINNISLCGQRLLLLCLIMSHELTSPHSFHCYGRTWVFLRCISMSLVSVHINKSFHHMSLTAVNLRKLVPGSVLLLLRQQANMWCVTNLNCGRTAYLTCCFWCLLLIFLHFDVLENITSKCGSCKTSPCFIRSEMYSKQIFCATLCSSSEQPGNHCIHS